MKRIENLTEEQAVAVAVSAIGQRAVRSARFERDYEHAFRLVVLVDTYATEEV